MRKPNRYGKYYTVEEDDYIYEKYGLVPLDAIARKLNRTPMGIYRRANVLGLGRSLEYSGYFTEYQITQILGIDSHTIRRNWSKKGFPQKRHKIRSMVTEVTSHDDLMTWLENNQELWDSRKVKLYALGYEPEWLLQKREFDKQKTTKPRGSKWTNKEDFYLCQYTRRGLTQKAIGERLGRSEASVNSRALKLDIWGTGKLKQEYSVHRKADYERRKNERL